jgi:hypothetical protein
VTEVAQFEELQARLRAHWPAVTLRSIGDVERTMIVVHSLSLQVPEQLYPVFPAYEERFLCLVFSLLRGPRSKVIYVTSQPVLPRLIDYFFGLVPTLDTPEARRRLALVTVVDGRNRPLTEKVLARPGVIERIRGLIARSELPVLVPFNTSELELELALKLGVPVYGTHPSLSWAGTKQGSRRLFAEEGVPHPVGLDAGSLADLVPAIQEIQGRRPGVRQVIVKLDDSVSGLGNAIVDVEGAETAAELRRRLAALELEDSEITRDDYLASFDREGGIVEERIEGESFRSPSVQLRLSPEGEAEVLSTHDQVLGGPHGQTYFGCRFPADEGYAATIAREAVKVGRRLAREGGLGRAAVDFVAVRDSTGSWQPYAVEINLRCGGTTHPFFALQSLTDGVYDVDEGRFRSPGGDQKFYVATDHLDNPAYSSLTPDDLLDLVEQHHLGWDEERQTGVALHMVSALAVAGRIGLTAIGDSHAETNRLYARVKQMLDEACGVAPAPGV